METLFNTEQIAFQKTRDQLTLNASSKKQNRLQIESQAKLALAKNAQLIRSLKQQIEFQCQQSAPLTPHSAFPDSQGSSNLNEPVFHPQRIGINAIENAL